MTEAVSFALDVRDWIRAGTDADALLTAALRIELGDAVLSSVLDSDARSVREVVYLPAGQLSEWLVVNWWRLRWEARPGRPGLDWMESHQIGAIGGGSAWPPIEICSDGEFIRVSMRGERRPDVAAIQYLRSVQEDIPARVFEVALDRFLDQVEARARSVALQSDLAELREELRSEREDPALAWRCRVQALAGLNPGEAGEGLLSQARKLADTAGLDAFDECLAGGWDLGGRLQTVASFLSRLQKSEAHISLAFQDGFGDRVLRGSAVAWEAGERAAQRLRAHLRLSGPIEQSYLRQLLEVPDVGPNEGWGPTLVGAWRDPSDGRARLGVRPSGPSRRFDLARVMGGALLAQDEALVPVTRGASWTQKYQRAFAAEFLCPWRDLDAFTDESGTDYEGIEDAAAYFDVSPVLVQSSLLNKRKLGRDRASP